VEVTGQFNNKSLPHFALCYQIKTKYLPVLLKNLKFLQNILQRYTIIAEFFENFKSIRIGGCFRWGGKT
jgi:hypothetical protein